MRLSSTATSSAHLLDYGNNRKGLQRKNLSFMCKNNFFRGCWHEAVLTALRIKDVGAGSESRSSLILIFML